MTTQLFEPVDAGMILVCQAIPIRLIPELAAYLANNETVQLTPEGLTWLKSPEFKRASAEYRRERTDAFFASLRKAVYQSYGTADELRREGYSRV